MIGPSRKLQRGPPAFWARSRANVRRSRQSARISCSWATRSGFELTGRNIRPRDCGLDGSRETGRPARPIRRVRVSYPRCTNPQERAAARAVAVRRRVPLPPLSRSRPCLRGRATSAPSPSRRRRSCSSRWSPGCVLRLDRIELLGLRPRPVRPDARLRRQPRRPVYRLVAIVDAYRVADVPERASRRAAAAGSGGRASVVNPLSIAGLLAVVLVMAGGHVVVARYDLLRPGRPRQRLHLPRATRPRNAICDTRRRRPSLPPTADRGRHDRADRDARTGQHARRARPLPEVSIPPWDGKERLNILLIGADQRPNEGTYNTDTLIVVSIDPVDQAGRDVQPAARHGRRAAPARPGPAGLRRGLPQQDQRLFTDVRNRADLVPGHQARPAATTALKAILGNLYGLDIKYFVEVNFDGFKQVVDALGGVTINVQVPVLDDSYPGRRRPACAGLHPGRHPAHDRRRGARYARSRHGSSDFDRGARQQRVLLSLREQADLAGPHPAPPAARRRAQGDGPDRHPVRPARASCSGSPSQVDTKNIRSYVFAPPLYATEDLQRPARLRRRPERRADPGGGRERVQGRSGRRGHPRRSLAEEGAQVWVLNGTSDSGRASDARRLPRLLRARRVGAAPEAGRCRPGEHDDRRLQRRRGEAGRDDRLPRADVRGQGRRSRTTRPSAPTSSSRSARRRPTSRRRPRPDARRRPRAPSRRRAAAPTRHSIGVSQWLYSGSRPRTASK